MNNTPVINVAKDFSRFPGGRFIADGNSSGERFRNEFLIPALSQNQSVTVELDGTLGYGSSFLEEAFGGLVREAGFTSDQLRQKLRLRTSDETLSYAINSYIKEAAGRKVVHH